MAGVRLVDVDGDNLSICDDRDFDQESLSELDLLDVSPRGGYTSEAFAESSSAAQSAKALEIAEERSLLGEDDFVATSDSAVGASSALIDTTAAPPCYSAAIASDRASTALETSWTERMPESMTDTGLLSQDRVERGDIYGSPERHLAKELSLVAGQTWRIFTEYIRSVEKKRGRNFGLTKRVVRFSIAALTVIIVLAISLPFIIRAIIDHRRDLEWERMIHPFRDHPAYKRDPHKDHPSTELCQFEVFSEYQEYDSGQWDVRRYRWGDYSDSDELDLNFNLVDKLDTNLPADFTDPKISGTVEIISIPRDHWHDSDITIRSNAATSRSWQSEPPLIDHDGHTFTLQSRGLKKSKSPNPTVTERSCLDVWVGIYIPVGIEIGNWTTSLRSLSFLDRRGYVFDPKSNLPHAQQVADGAIKVTDSTVIKSNQGSIDISYWNSHRTTLETRAGHVRGKYSFYDSMSVKTLGGKVDVEIDPLGVALSRDQPHARKLATSTGSGDTIVTVLDPSGQDWTSHLMESTHRTTSGSMQLQYPSEWAGTIEGITMSDHAKVEGKDVHKNEAKLDAPGEIHMMKGRASDWAGTLGRIDLESETGSIDLVVGAM